MSVTKAEIAAALGLSVDEADTMTALVQGLAAGGLTAETASVYAGDLGMARMLTVLDGFALALDTGADGGATATAALSAARAAVASARTTVTALRSSGGDPADAQAAVVTAATALGAAAQAVGAWAAGIAAAIPQG